MYVCDRYERVNYGCPVAKTWRPLEPLWLDVATTDAVYEIPALSPPSGMSRLTRNITIPCIHVNQ